jgi:hypothetical protein
MPALRYHRNFQTVLTGRTLPKSLSASSNYLEHIQAWWRKVLHRAGKMPGRMFLTWHGGGWSCSLPSLTRKHADERVMASCERLVSTHPWPVYSVLDGYER